MELLGTACLLLAALCTCALGQGEISNVTVNAYVSTSMPKTEEKAVNMITSRAMTLQTTELTTTTASTMTVSVTTSCNTTIPANATEGTTQHTIVQQPAQVTPTARSESDNTTSASQVNGTQSTQNESSSATTAKTRTLSPTASLQENTTAPGTSKLSVSTPAIKKEGKEIFGKADDFGSPGNSSENTKALEDTIHYSSVILPIVIALIVITLSAFSLVALYRVCHKKTPDRQENGTEQAQSDKEGVKLLSVKTTSAETGENQGKNKTRQCDDSSSNFSSKYM
ncbi:endomucin isoform X3 [Numida meleagris]|uniref:endomucin isoform X3 n=1 Tax=Numida meleagris TaxID=8996 RepID=UPI000B3E1C57|nr:endomucin isoform X3 [Numida meleagris]